MKLSCKSNKSVNYTVEVSVYMDMDIDNKEQKKVTKINKVLFQISKVPYSLWMFFMLYNIYRLVTVASEIESKKQEFTKELINVCYTIQNSSNFVLDLQTKITTNTVNDIVNVTNEAMASIEDGLKFITTLGPEIFTLFVEYKTKLFRCPTVAVLTMATQGLLSKQAEIEADINNGLSNIVDSTNNLIGTFVNDINSVTGEYNNIMNTINNYMIANNLPPINVMSFSSLNPIVIPAVSVPITNWQTPDYEALFNDLITMIDPLTYLSSYIHQISFVNVTSQQIMDDLGIENNTNKKVEFCSQMNITKFERISDDVIDAVYGFIGLIVIMILIVLLVETAVIVNNNRQKPFVLMGPKLSRFIKHIWYKPSITCLLFGLLGIMIYKSLQVATNDARQKYIISVIYPIQTNISTDVDDISNALDLLSVKFANLVNGEVDDVKTVFTNIQDNITTVANDLIGFQTEANLRLNQTVGSVVLGGQTLLTLIDCMAVILNQPLTGLYSVIPNLNDFPVVPDSVFSFNKTYVKVVISNALNITTYPFDYYYNKFESDVQIYYYLTAYGSVVFVGGLLFALYDIYQQY
jgi:hypothetical protein